MKKINCLLLICAFVFSTSHIVLGKKVTNVDENNNKSEVIHLTKAMFLKNVVNFEKNPKEWLYLGDKPCVIDFYANWCGPCRMVSPVIEELAKEYKGKIYVYKIDTQKEQELASVFGIRSIPAFLFCPPKGQPKMVNGIGSSLDETKKMFKKIIDDFLLKK